MSSQAPQHEGKLVRERAHGSGKFHIANEQSVTLCGVVPSTPFGFALSADRDAYEAISPDRICKRCLKAEAADA